MRPQRRVLARGLAGLFSAGVVVCAVLGSAAPAGAAGGNPCPGATCGVDGDPAGSAYVGEGGLLLPADSFTGAEADRAEAATCTGCRWALVPTCKRGGLGNGGCGPATRACPPGERRMEVFLRRPGEPLFRSLGLVCVVPGGPLTVTDVASRVHDVVIRQVPPLRPGVQPAGTTLVGLPTLFATGQPPALDARSFVLVGFTIRLQARATWAWSFGDGAELVTADPGGVWPDVSLTHTYRQAGDRTVRVTTVWDGWFTADGLGPFPVGGQPVTQSATLPLAVREARAVLVSQ